MKTTYFLFAVIGVGAFSLGISFAGPPSDQPSGKDANENHSTGDHPADLGHGNQANGTEDQTDKKQSQSNADSHIPEKISQAGSTKTPPKHPPVNNPSRPTLALNKTPTVAKGGLPVNKPGSNSAQLTRPPMGGGTAVLGPGIVRKSAGPTASLGELTASSIKTSTAGINGTGMQRTTYR